MRSNAEATTRDFETLEKSQEEAHRYTAFQKRRQSIFSLNVAWTRILRPGYITSITSAPGCKKRIQATPGL